MKSLDWVENCVIISSLNTASISTSDKSVIWAQEEILTQLIFSTTNRLGLNIIKQGLISPPIGLYSILLISNLKLNLLEERFRQSVKSVE